MESAAQEFGERPVPKDQAEQIAYAKYVRRRHLEAAAHHWRGMTAAQAIGDRDVAGQHKLLYDVHVRELGENPAGPVSSEVRALAGDADFGRRPRFKAHPADALPLLRCEPLLAVAVKAAVVQVLEKTSKNVRYWRKHGLDRHGQVRPLGEVAGLDAGPGLGVDGRRERFARSIGLRPSNSAGIAFPKPQGNSLPYSYTFDLDHELAHAVMTPPGKTLGTYIRDLSATADLDYPAGGPVPARKLRGSADEGVARYLEQHVDRRSGVDPHLFGNEFRPDQVKLTREGEVEDVDYQDQHRGRQLLSRFDAGARFDRRGAVRGPGGIDGKIKENEGKARGR